MKCEIEDAEPDGLVVRITHEFYFDTYEEAFATIAKIDEVISCEKKQTLERFKQEVEQCRARFEKELKS